MTRRTHPIGDPAELRDVDAQAFVGELRVLLALDGVLTHGGGWCVDPPADSSLWTSWLASGRRLLRLAFTETECAHAIVTTGEGSIGLWPERPLVRGTLQLMLVHIDEEIATRTDAEQQLVLTFPDGTARVRPEPASRPTQRRF